MLKKKTYISQNRAFNTVIDPNLRKMLKIGHVIAVWDWKFNQNIQVGYNENGYYIEPLNGTFHL